jgi:hypothetical protein
MMKLAAVRAVGEEAVPRLHEQVAACSQGDWRWLVVVATEPGLSALPLAEAIAERCVMTGERRAKAWSGEDRSRAELSSLVSEVTNHLEAGGRAVVAIDALTGSRAGLPVALAADAALLCVHLGVSTTVNALRTVELLGRERFVGAVTLEPGVRT